MVKWKKKMRRKNNDLETKVRKKRKNVMYNILGKREKKH